MTEHEKVEVQRAEGREMLTEAGKAREMGNFTDALNYADRAFVWFLKNKDYLGAGESRAERALDLRHLYRATGEEAYILDAINNAHSAVDIAGLSSESGATVIPLYNLGKTYEEVEKYQEALESYDEAIEVMENTPPAAHSSPAVLADMRVHRETCAVKDGDMSRIDASEEALAVLIRAEHPDTYARDVWISGGHMRLAEALQVENPDKAREHLEKAKTVIDGNADLVIRKEQWEKLAASFTS